jgi:predicted GNAT family acetyltransferase
LSKDEDLRRIHEFNIKAFSDEDLEWTYENLKSQLNDGWILYAANFEGSLVAAAFVKVDGDELLTKNTSISVDYQGNGFSHMIKDFFEDVARDEGVKKLINLCPFDNFRMISLNERHEYTKTGNKFGKNKEIIEWVKLIN